MYVSRYIRYDTYVSWKHIWAWTNHSKHWFELEFEIRDSKISHFQSPPQRYNHHCSDTQTSVFNLHFLKKNAWLLLWLVLRRSEAIQLSEAYFNFFHLLLSNYSCRWWEVSPTNNSRISLRYFDRLGSRIIFGIRIYMYT